MKGTLLPTTICASSLSSVIWLGVLTMLVLVWLCRARAMEANAYCPPKLRMRPTLMPSPSLAVPVSAPVCSWMMLLPPVLKLVPAASKLVSPLLPTMPCH